ncbi:MarR family transcriptional regulator [Dactylosporangium sp. NPDC049525]|uniref:MarR family winged helix-turn-helix transcriptional regulator n=1 Tax=Dactylosporangium sp. NPDC049525 TaxID=3154730 RepID=UPI00341476F3
MKRTQVDALTTLIEDFNTLFIRLPMVQRLGFSALSVVHTLSRRGPMRLTALTATEQLTQPAITSLVQRLEEDGLVERRADPTDGRAVLVTLTAAGADIVRSRHASRVDRLAELIAGLDGAEQDAIAAAMPAFARVIKLGAA